MVNVVSDAYSSRAAEYVERFASMGAADPSNRQRVVNWADGIEGPVLDAGCDHDAEDLEISSNWSTQARHQLDVAPRFSDGLGMR
jgi:hypothetical protein